MVTYSVADAKADGMKVGSNVLFVDTPNFGSEPYLIEIGDDTAISFDVAFVTHDGSTRVIRNLGADNETIIYGKIIVGKNCFIGCRTTILPNVKIGDNSIIGAGSVVTKDIPSNSVACGVPCRVIGTVEEWAKKHEKDFDYILHMPREEKKKYIC